MSNSITGSFKISGLKSVKMDITGKKGNKVKCLVIPIAENNLFEGQSGIYVNIIAWPYKEVKEGRKDTHYIRQSFPKEQIEKMTSDEKEAIPFLGNLNTWEAQPTSTEIDQTAQPEPAGPKDDLPF